MDYIITGLKPFSIDASKVIINRDNLCVEQLFVKGPDKYIRVTTY